MRSVSWLIHTAAMLSLGQSGNSSSRERSLSQLCKIIQRSRAPSSISRVRLCTFTTADILSSVAELLAGQSLRAGMETYRVLPALGQNDPSASECSCPPVSVCLPTVGHWLEMPAPR